MRTTERWGGVPEGIVWQEADAGWAGVSVRRLPVPGGRRGVAVCVVPEGPVPMGGRGRNRTEGRYRRGVGRGRGYGRVPCAGLAGEAEGVGPEGPVADSSLLSGITKKGRENRKGGKKGTRVSSGTGRDRRVARAERDGRGDGDPGSVVVGTETESKKEPIVFTYR